MEMGYAVVRLIGENFDSVERVCRTITSAENYVAELEATNTGDYTYCIFATEIEEHEGVL